MPESINRVINILIPAIIISLGSVVILRSITPALTQYQFIFAVCGILGVFLLSRISIDFLKINPWIWYALTLIPLILTELFGYVSRGSARWILIGNFRFQSSEFAKITLILFAAAWLSKQRTQTVSTTIRFVLLILLPAFIVSIQPDLGTAIMYGAIALIALLAAGTPFKHFLIALVAMCIAVPLFIANLKPYQYARIESFIAPQKDLLGAGYNARQATIAIGSGQFTGKGIGQGTQSHLRFLPERQTDFAYASFVEELGFLGGFVLILTYIWLFVSIIKVAQISNNPSHQLFCLITAGMLITQTMINIGMNMGLLPITGITLPLFSYGGSSMISTYILLGLVANIAIKTPNSGKHLEIR